MTDILQVPGASAKETGRGRANRADQATLGDGLGPPSRGRTDTPEQAVIWSDFSGHSLVVFQPRHGLNVLGVLRGTEFSQAGSSLLVQQASA